MSFKDVPSRSNGLMFAHYDRPGVPLNYSSHDSGAMSTIPSASFSPGPNAADKINSLADMCSNRWDSSEEAYTKLVNLQQQAGYTIYKHKRQSDQRGKPRYFKINCKNRKSD